MSIGSTDDREPYPNLLSNCLKLKPPLDDNAADRLERMLRKRDVAAFIMEPISCSLGVLIPDDAFMARLPKLCHRYGTLLIMDEVATGFGRTGRLFASEHFDLEPDILCMAKALSGGFVPIGATITTEKIAKSIEGDIGFYSTYGWHPASVAMTIANVRWILRNRTRLFRHVDKVSTLFAARLSAMRFQSEPELRIRGLAIGIDVGDNKYASRIVERCRRNGLLLTESDTTLTLFPALTIEEETAEKGVEILARAAR